MKLSDERPAGATFWQTKERSIHHSKRFKRRRKIWSFQGGTQESLNEVQFTIHKPVEQIQTLEGRKSRD
jgi:hypothetical protein